VLLRTEVVVAVAAPGRVGVGVGGALDV